MREEPMELPTTEWWGRHRLRYNIGLAIAGLLAFVTYAAIILIFEERIPDAEFTVFTVLFQAVGYLVAMGIANICYFLGPMSERILKPKNLTTYRETTYKLGFWFSVVLPFSIPVFVGYVIATSV